MGNLLTSTLFEVALCCKHVYFVPCNGSIKKKNMNEGANPGGGGGPPLKFTRNTPKNVCASLHFFKYAPPNLKSWILPWNVPITLLF
jgi:hypothetical protein